MKFCVIGLGKFGFNLATLLAEEGNEVLVVDKNEDYVNDIKDFVTRAVCANIDDVNTLIQIGIEDISTVIITIGEDFAQSVLITALLKKELNIPNVIARASSEIHETILRLVGAHQIISLEKEMATRLSERLSMPIGEISPLHEDFAAVKVRVHKRFAGKTVKQLLENKAHKLSCVAALKGNEMFLVTPEYVIMENDTLMFVGNKKAFSLLLDV